MTQDKHTPGPWRVYERTPVRIITESKRVIATVRGWGTPEGDANARLIAAAPETAAERDRLKAINAQMLEALRAIEAFFALNDRTSSWGRASASASWAAAKAAIAAATLDASATGEQA